MKLSWQNRNDFGTSIAFQVSTRNLHSPGSSEILWPEFLSYRAGEKNSVRGLWIYSTHFLRSETPPSPGSVLWRHANLPGDGNPPGFLPQVWESETGKAGLVGRSAFLHQAICFLRRSAVPGFEYPGYLEGTAPGLEDGQDSGDAVSAGAAAKNGNARAEGNWN